MNPDGLEESEVERSARLEFEEHFAELGRSLDQARRWLREHAPENRRLRSWVEDYHAGHEALSYLEPVVASYGLSPGAVVAGFRLVRLLGTGGQGQVWEAEQTSLGRRVALKLARPDAVRPRTLRAVAREARAGGRLNHPGIVAVHDTGESDGIAWISQELVEGGMTLHQRIAEQSRSMDAAVVRPRAVATLVARVADALEVAHRAGIIHRDVKPLNILLTPQGSPKLTDFGMARLTTETAESTAGGLLGTLMYMSPEQVEPRRHDLTPATDIFSLGVVLYEMLALRRPFEGDTAIQIARKIEGEDPPRLTDIRSRVPRSLELIVNKALQKAPAARYPSMGAFADDLRRYLSGQPVAAAPAPYHERLQRWIRRRPAASVALASLVVGLAVVSILLARNLQTSQRLRSEIRLVDRLSALPRLEALVAEADEESVSWPPHPSRIPGYRDWINRALELARLLPDHQETRARWPRSAKDSLAHRRAPRGAMGDPDHGYDWLLRELTHLTNELEGLLSPSTGLLSADGVSPQHGWSVPRRLAFAERLEAEFGPRGATAHQWTRDLPRIRAAYPGIDIGRQMGLVPLGPDPASGLWEFGHLQSGTPPSRDAAGLLAIDEETCIVLILLPGGTFWMGAQNEDPLGPRYDPLARQNESPLHQVTLDPFFISKYEVTQGQWQRLMGENPSSFQPDQPFSESGLLTQPLSLKHPVEDVSWTECARVSAMAGLALPTEAQWEYAARGGTNTPWWTGATPTSLIHRANLAQLYPENEWPYDGYVFRVPRNEFHSSENWPVDGFVLHAPVDWYDPNPFGLFNVLGNVWEWCMDRYGSYDSAVEPGSGLRREGLEPFRVFRGGAFVEPPQILRVSYRDDAAPDNRGSNFGFRPVRELRPDSVALGDR